MAAEIKLRAERRAGELLAGLDKATGGGDTSGGTLVVPPQESPTLSDMGITKNQSSQWQRVAAKLANMDVGANQHTQVCVPSQSQTAEMLNISERSLRTAKKGGGFRNFVCYYGIMP